MIIGSTTERGCEMTRRRREGGEVAMNCTALGDITISPRLRANTTRAERALVMPLTTHTRTQHTIHCTTCRRGRLESAAADHRTRWGYPEP
eukprot:6253514-Pyramimonas_sp.AAC.1